METARVLIIDSDPDRRARTCEKLRSHRYDVIEAASESAALGKGHEQKPDLALLRVGSRIDFFYEFAAVSQHSGTFIALVMERNFSPVFRKEVLALKADGFINEELPEDEWIASIHAFLRQKQAIDELKHAGGSREKARTETKPGVRQEANSSARGNEAVAPLRDRSPDVYKDVLHRYEEAVKLVLQHRIYKIDDDVFEPFRQIAKQLFLVDATARDAVELHYQTLRKIAPAPDAPRAQAYLEIGRTTIIGLLGDLLTFYREADRNYPKENSLNGLADGLTEATLNK
jgi:DNA-binding response OmpR family regulator